MTLISDDIETFSMQSYVGVQYTQSQVVIVRPTAAEVQFPHRVCYDNVGFL
jgi:hypothetical protein